MGGEKVGDFRKKDIWGKPELRERFRCPCVTDGEEEENGPEPFHKEHGDSKVAEAHQPQMLHTDQAGKEREDRGLWI